MLFILTVQFLQCKYIQGLIQISQYKIQNSILYCFCVCKKYNVALYYISHFIMHQNISGDRSFIVLNEGYILKYHTRDLFPEVGGKSSLLKTLCTQTKGSESPELYVIWKHPPWGCLSWLQKVTFKLSKVRNDQQSYLVMMPMNHNSFEN